MGKVTDERAVEGGGQVALKRGWGWGVGDGGGDRQDRSQGVKIPFKRSSPGEKKPAGHKSRPRDT